MGLRYGGKIVDDYSAMRGPCPSGFHVPSQNEWETVFTIGTTLSAWSSSATCESALNLTDHTILNRTSGGTSSLNGAKVRTCTRYSTEQAKAASTAANSQGLTNEYRTFGYHIRPFKDTSVIPDSSWSVYFDGGSVATGAGIFHNQTLGLISLSADGVSWVTMAYENLDGYYQWGNCNKFIVGGYTTSSTKFNATNYGPGNYYSSNVFITGTSWDSSRNQNLRGGVTGIQQRPAPIVKRYYGGKMIYDYSAMKGPCPVGFHVPLTSESTTLVTALSDLGMDTSNGADISQYLKIPYAGYRYYTTGDISQQGVAGGYWASDGYSDSNYRLGNCVLFTSTVLYANNNQYRTLALPVRPYKDTPVIPDSGWTQLYAGTGNSGVFHNSTLGLISISSDGTNWITIADKNLGATTVYNNGDTLSESNCGGYFQRGNNYMFPFTGNITTTYGYVDATNYGPGNYYSDSTFIKSTLSTRDWCYPANNDLRGRTTGPQQTPVEILKTYYGNTLIWEKP